MGPSLVHHMDSKQKHPNSISTSATGSPDPLASYSPLLGNSYFLCGSMLTLIRSSALSTS